MTTLILSLALFAQQGKPLPPITNAGGDPPQYISNPWSVQPEPVGGSISGPDTVTIPSGASQSLLFGISLTRTDSDTFREFPNNVPTNVVHGTAISIGVNEDPDNGMAVPGGQIKDQALTLANVTTSSSSATSITESYNYRAIKLQDTPYPLERVLSYELYDKAPSTSLPNNPDGWRIRDTNRPVLSKNITVILGS